MGCWRDHAIGTLTPAADANREGARHSDLLSPFVAWPHRRRNYTTALGQGCRSDAPFRRLSDCQPDTFVVEQRLANLTQYYRESHARDCYYSEHARLYEALQIGIIAI